MIKTLFLLVMITGCGKPILDKTENQLYSSLLKGVDQELLLETEMSLNFDLLPMEGSVRGKNRLWSGDAWPLMKGAINNRWNSPEKKGFDYLSPNRRQLGVYSLDQLKILSPSEKYDLWMGRYDYPLKREVDFLARKGTLSWEGLCHGFAGASLNHPEPEAKMMENPDGLLIPFGSSDIKALLTYAYSKILIAEGESIGKRCEKNSQDGDRCEEDLTALSFHVVLANKIGLRNQSFIADLDRSEQVWNFPISGYKIKPISIISNRSGKNAILETKISYVDVVDKNSWERHPPVIGHMTVHYELQMDKQGKIIKGKWLSQERPDFLWRVRQAVNFEGYLANVIELIK